MPGDQRRLLGGVHLGKPGGRAGGLGGRHSAAGVGGRRVPRAPAPAAGRRRSRPPCSPAPPGTTPARPCRKAPARASASCRERIDLLEAEQRHVADLLRSAARPGDRNRPSRAEHDAPNRLGGAIGSISPSTGWKAFPRPLSASRDTASLCRSSDFGVITTSGLRKLRLSCRRSAWK